MTKPFQYKLNKKHYYLGSCHNCGRQYLSFIVAPKELIAAAEVKMCCLCSIPRKEVKMAYQYKKPIQVIEI